MAVSIKIYQDDELMVQYNGVDIYARGGSTDQHESLNFKYSERIEKNKPCWTGKFICVENNGNYSFTPGKVYKVTETDVYDDTPISFKRRNGPGCMFSIGTFDDLQDDFLNQGIVVIEYKGGAEE